jgi:hypothetical protein
LTEVLGLRALSPEDFKNLREGDCIRGGLSGEVYTIVRNNGNGTYVAVRTVLVTNPSEWTLVLLAPRPWERR